MRSRAERFGLPPPTIADAECTLGIGGGDGGTDASRPPRAAAFPVPPSAERMPKLSWIAGGKAGLGRVLGRNKATLAALREATGLRFEVDNDAKRVTIAGDRDAIAVAANLVASIANVPDSGNTPRRRTWRAFADARAGCDIASARRNPDSNSRLLPGNRGTTGSRSSSTRRSPPGIIIGKEEDHLGADEAERVRHDLRPGEEDGSLVGRNREVAAAGERLILDILADARAKRASAKDTADVGEDGDARVDDRGGDDDYGEGGAENRAGESRKRPNPRKTPRRRPKI